MRSPEGDVFPIPFREDSGMVLERKDGINLKKLHRIVGLVDFTNPPEGIVFIGEPLPEAATHILMQSLSAPKTPARRKK